MNFDNSEAHYQQYLRDMPFYALPYSERPKILEAAKNYKVGVFPSVVLVDEEAEYITNKGLRAMVATKDAFPWRPKPLTVSTSISMLLLLL